MNRLQLFILAIYSLSVLNSTIRTRDLTNSFAPDFEQAMVCDKQDVDDYHEAYAHDEIDQSFFDFAHKQYATYIQQKKGYSVTPRIPKIIHQIWIGPNNPPEQFKEWQQTWLNLHPDWEYKLWTDDDVDKLVMINQEYYDEERNFAAKADILRLEILNQFGGLYVDIDFECIKPFDPIHHLCDFYIGFFQVNYLKSSARVNNAIIGAHKNHPIIQELIHEIKNNRGSSKLRYKKILERTGPSFVTKVIKQSIYDMAGINVIFPANYFYPWTGPRKTMYLNIQPETMAIHYYTGTWHRRKKNRLSPLIRLKKRSQKLLN